VDFPVKTLKKYNNRHINLAAISQGVKDVLVNCGVTGDIPIVYSGVPVPAFPSEYDAETERNALGLPSDYMVFGTAANFAPHKDFPTMLKAFNEYLSTGGKGKLLLVGGGKGFDESVRLAENLGITKDTIFTGFKEDVAKYLKCMDIYIVTSSSEGLNTSIIDAMHASLPIIASKVGGIPELVRNGENGYLVEAGDYRAFASAMHRLSEEPAIRNAFSKSSLQRGKSFTDQFMTNGYIGLYQSLSGI
jgi:glycosyltransferase involved in cell wall biosynthesis